jgi:hypothetical protein
MSGGDGDVRVVKALDLRLIPDSDCDAELSERLIRQLRAELLELDVESVRFGDGDPMPDGVKAADPVTVGAIVVALSASRGVFISLIATLRDWLNRHAARHRVSVTIGNDTLVLEKTSAEQRQQLVDAFVRRHASD